ncbi:phage tail fiber protein [Paenibacillus apiarius]|uniref:phage tail fiber protein n=1 Tax=Paenibacillus apiarius TaxID=46240 RepID=UPI003B3A4FD6
MNLSHYYAGAILEATFRGVAYAFPSKVYIALYTTNPTAVDTGQEVTGGAYQRLEVPYANVIIENGKKTIKNSADIVFSVATADWGAVTHAGIRDAASGGNLLIFGALKSPRSILAGDRFRIMENELVLTLS